MAEDLLNVQRWQMTSLGWFMDMVMGRATAVAGLPCTPTTPPSMAVQIGPGMLCQGATIDGTQYGTLPLNSDNTSPLVKAGLLESYDPSSMLFNLAAPTQSGQSINYLIEASLLEVDDTPLTLPYFNSANPLQAFLGPGGNGASVFTRRAQKVQLQLKAGVPAVDGFQVTPSADAGWVPLWIITTKFGDTSINSSRIVQHPAAPFVINKLPQLQPLLGGRIRRVLTANLNLYVSPTGNDSNDGQTLATPFQTRQAAINYITSNLDLNNFGVNINLSAGTWNDSVTSVGVPVGWGVSSFITFKGAGSATVISTSSGPCFASVGGSRIGVQFMQMGAPGTPGNYSASGSVLVADLAGVIFIGQGLTFNASIQSHMTSSRGGVVSASPGGIAYTIAGGASAHMQSSEGATIDNVASTITLTGSPNFSAGFANAGPGSVINGWSCTFIGAATGPRYSVSAGGYINTQGGGANYFPGNSAGLGAGAANGLYG